MEEEDGWWSRGFILATEERWLAMVEGIQSKKERYIFKIIKTEYKIRVDAYNWEFNNQVVFHFQWIERWKFKIQEFDVSRKPKGNGKCIIN